MIWLLIGYMWLFIHRPFEIWPVLATVRLERVYMLTVLAIWLCSGPKGLVPNRLNRAFAFFTIVLVAAWLLSPYQELGTGVVEGWFKVGVFVVLLVTTVRDERQLRTIIIAFLVIMALYMLHSLREYYCGRYVWRMGTRRMIGVDATYNDPNTFAATLLYALPMLLPFWTKEVSRRTKLLVIAYLVLTLSCILLTGSRAGFLGLIFLGLIYVLFISRRRFRLLLALALAAPLVWAVLPEDRQNRYLTIIDPSYGPAGAEASARGRRQGFDDGVRLWGENPVLGVGPGAFGTAAGTGKQAHNLYGQVLGELGTIGALAFVAVVLAFARNWFEVRRMCRYDAELSSRFSSRLVKAIGIIILLLLFMGMGGHNLHRYTWLWLAAMQSLALYCLHQQVHLEPHEQDPEPFSSELLEVDAR